MKLTILGMNGPFPAPDGATSGYLLETPGAALQLDLGCGTLAALCACRAPETLTALILTHWHNDHCSDVLPLIYRMDAYVATHPGKQLHIYAPVDETSPVRQAVLSSASLVLHDIAPGDELDLGVRVKVYPARHPVPAVMLRLTDGDITLCYTGDTNTQPILAEYAQGADLLLADGLFPTAAWAESKPHLSAALCAQLAADAQAKRLVITHLNPTLDSAVLLREAQAIYPAAMLAERGLTLEL